MEGRAWTFEDVKKAYFRHEQLRQTQDPMRHYLYGVALEMAGNEDCDDKYMLFVSEVIHLHSSAEQGAEFYSSKAKGAKGASPQDREWFEHMAVILRRPPVKDGKRRASQQMSTKGSQTCAVM